MRVSAPTMAARSRCTMNGISVGETADRSLCTMKGANSSLRVKFLCPNNKDGEVFALKKSLHRECRQTSLCNTKHKEVAKQPTGAFAPWQRSLCTMCDIDTSETVDTSLCLMDSGRKASMKTDAL